MFNLMLNSKSLYSEVQPKVSVTVVTYNHGEWLAECLDSIVKQVTDFDFEVIVGDDASTDRHTLQIIEEYSQKYPGIIIPIYRKINIGPINNLFDTISRARGEYIAHMDGDDIMLPLKLQKQANYLDVNRNVTIAAHRMCLLSGHNYQETDTYRNIPEIGTIYDLLLSGCYFCHSSKMYRVSALITKQSMLPIVDYFLHIEHALNGNIYFSNEILGGHRIHEHGMSINNAFKKFIEIAYERSYDRALELGVDRNAVERGRIRHHHAMALSFLKNNQTDLFIKYARIDKYLLPFSSYKQKIIHYLSLFPEFAYLLFRLRTKAKTSTILRRNRSFLFFFGG